jgi:hypothetical protein
MSKTIFKLDEAFRAGLEKLLTGGENAAPARENAETAGTAESAPQSPFTPH